MSAFIIPDWPAPARVAALSTTRQGGVSRGAWHSFNLGEHCGDDAGAVQRNRALLGEHLPAKPNWLQQVHGSEVVRHSGMTGSLQESRQVADGQVTTEAGAVCAILTADCLPVLFCNRHGTQVAAAHAGWRGLAAGVLQRTIGEMSGPASELLAWMGPAIGPAVYEVGDEVKAAFAQLEAEGANAFVARGERWLFDLYAMARHVLQRAGVGHISGGGFCTFSDDERFFSYRRDSVTGRMASLIWLR